MLTILIVDDHPAIALAMRTESRQAAVVHSGQAALDFLLAQPVALMILDVSMPEMSGLDVLRFMKAGERHAGIPVVMFSCSDEDRDESLRLGAVDFVLKQDADQLPMVVDRHVKTC
jgi:CheY-like chemotaxis protein